MLKHFFIKDICYHIASPFNFLALETLEALTSLSLWIKLIMGQLLLLLLCKFYYVFYSFLATPGVSSFLLLVLLMISSGYAANYTRKEHLW